MAADLYEEIGVGYALGRKTDPHIARAIHRYLSGAKNILNVGAGSGGYEPHDTDLIALEPSQKMLAQRAHAAYPAIQACAEALPFADDQFSHVMTVLSMHHWRDRSKAFTEIKRVVTDRFVALSWDPLADPYWLTQDYFPQVHEIDQAIFPSREEIAASFPNVRFHHLPIPADCLDGFTAAYWARPEAYLDINVRRAMSTFTKIDSPNIGIQQLADDLASGRWHARYGGLLDQSELDVGYFLSVWDAR